MAIERQATATYTGLGKVMGATVTMTRGITPSTISFLTVPQVNLTQSVGDVTVEYGLRMPSGEIDPTDTGAESFTLVDCAVDSSSIDMSNAQTWSFQVFDRRWRWKRGEISGKYNQVLPDGGIDTTTSKTNQELATLCLDAMEETGYDVSNVPNAPAIKVEWDVTNPASALQELCDKIKCEITIALDEENNVVIHRKGVGADLPTSKVRSFSTSSSSGQAPATIRAVVGPTLIQRRMLLEAVGVETAANDSEIVPIADLSYEPVNGFRDPQYMFDVIASDEAQKLALDSVFRYYRPLEFADGSLALPSVSPGFLDSEGTAITTLTSIRQIQLTSGLIETHLTGDEYLPKPPRVIGNYFDNGILGTNVSGKLYKGEFQVDTRRGLVIFREPVVYDSGSGVWGEPELYLEAAFTVLDSMRSHVRHRRSSAFPGTNYDGGIHVIREEGKRRAVRMPYTTLTAEGTADDNVTGLDTELDELIAIAEDAFEIEEGTDAVYGGIVPIELDGTIQQVVWTVGYGRPAETRIGRNKDADQFGLSEEFKRDREITALDIQKSIQFIENGKIDPLLRPSEGAV